MRTQGQALVHVLVLASLRGLVVRGPMAGRQHAYVLVRDWLGATPQAPRDRDAALAELARRYLRGHAPASDRDLAKWAGITLGDARRGLAGVRRLAERPDGLVALPDTPAGADAYPPPRLLGSFDPVLHGWTTREPVLGEHDATVASGGLFRPFALVRGRGVATWRYERRRVALEPFAPIAKTDRAALDADAEDVARFLG